MAGLYSDGLARLMDRWPGKHRLGNYRFLPLFMLAGAALEYAMINWRVGETNFYSVYKRKRVHEIAMQRLEQERETRTTSNNGATGDKSMIDDVHETKSIANESTV